MQVLTRIKGGSMKINEQVHLIRKEFNVTPEVKRYINLYLIVGKYCYLIDSGVAGTERLIEEYLKSIGRKMTDIKGIFLTHSHPDHIGAAAEIKRKSNCKIYAPALEMPWIEDIEKQFKERPIPNFFKLVSESVKVDNPLVDAEIIEPEEGIRIRTLMTCGHSHGSISYIFNDNFVFIGDAVPVVEDLPIFVNYEETMRSLDKLQNLLKVQYYCPAWDRVYKEEEMSAVLESSREMLIKLKNAVIQVESEMLELSKSEKMREILRRADMLRFFGNPLVMKSIEAVKDMNI